MIELIWLESATDISKCKDGDIIVYKYAGNRYGIGQFIGEDKFLHFTNGNGDSPIANMNTNWIKERSNSFAIIGNSRFLAVMEDKILNLLNLK